MRHIKALMTAAAFVLALSGHVPAQGTLDAKNSGGAVDSSKGAVNSAPSAVNSAPSAVEAAPSAVDSSRGAVDSATPRSGFPNTNQSDSPAGVKPPTSGR